ncbi:hypothetical protein A943_09725 [Bacillus sp. CPSM8]|jgi:hypothetical protein|nr:hypothetical protein A943_09725 [Bacillus sp. CPSM8]KUL13930.1 hypothetical protein LI7559_05025 [Bacillus licheniformis LMG 7559]KUL15058.1 hypothetical protein LI6934_22170 [Bacillus licheniformis LMG 6934]
MRRKKSKAPADKSPVRLLRLAKILNAFFRKRARPGFAKE